MKKEIAEKILSETETGYDLIAQKFSQTRKHFWRGLEFIKDYTHENDNVLDFGCGNGRLLGLFENQNINYWGVDVSEKLIECAKSQHVGDKIIFQKISPNWSISSPNFSGQHMKGNGKGGFVQEGKEGKNEQEKLGLDTSFADNFFNTIYSIAVFHHFPSEKYRQDVAKELFRITAEGGHVIVTAWYLWPSFDLLRRGKQIKYYKNIFRNWKEKISSKSALDWNDCLISFTDNHGKKFERFHHAFTKRELKKLFESAGFETEKCEVADGRNILYIGKKV